MRHALILRNACEPELDLVADLLVEAYAYLAGFFPPALWDAYRAEVAGVRSRLGVSELIVAARDRDVLGSVTFYPQAARDEHAWPDDTASFRLLAVRPDARGLGVGRSLVDECARRAREHGATALGLHTAPVMADATRLYARMGFARAPAWDFDPFQHYRAGALPPGERVPGLAYLMPL